MHTAFIFLTTLIALTSTHVSAQANQAFCTTCIVTSSIKQSPACDGLQNQPPPKSGVLTEKQKQCYCGLASANDGGAWIQPCVGPSSCDDTTVAMVLQTYANLKTSACEGIVFPSASAGGNGTTLVPGAVIAPSTQSRNNAVGSGMSSSRVATVGLAAMIATTVASFL